MEPTKQEIIAAADEAFVTISSPTRFEEYSYAWRFCPVCRKFSALSKRWGQDFVCSCGWNSPSEKA